MTLCFPRINTIISSDRRCKDVLGKVALSAVLAFFVICCAPANPSANQLPQEGSSFTAAFLNYLQQPPLQRNRTQLLHHLSEYALDDIDSFLKKNDPLTARQAASLFGQAGLKDIIEAHGEDFFTVMLHNTVGCYSYLDLLDDTFGLDPQRLTQTVIASKSRYTGAMIILEDIALSHFRSIVQVLDAALPTEVMLDSFYRDPYLLSSAIRILVKGDPQGAKLKEFFTFLPDKSGMIRLFRDDLPGLVVTFKTIQEIKFGNGNQWASQALSLTDEQLGRLILQKPESMAYILYGGYRIGIDNFKTIIRDIGEQPFQEALDKHTHWLADFFTGMKKISSFSSEVDFNETKAALAAIRENHSHLLEYETYLDPKFRRIMELFAHLPQAEQFLSSTDKAIQTRVYLLGLLSLYQRILHERIPEAKLTALQFNLLKQQILYSTRFTQHLNNMISNFEVGHVMVQDKKMETIVLLLAHELAHQIYSISGFSAPLLSSNSIHECSADIGARSISQRLGYNAGIEEYADKYVRPDDYSENDKVKEGDLIGQRIPHILGRTQLGYIVQGLNNSEVQVDWQTLFSVNLSVLREKTKIKNMSYVRDLVGAYTYYTDSGAVSYDAMQRFTDMYERSYASASKREESQLAQVHTVEEMILIARSLIVRTAATRQSFRNKEFAGYSPAM